MVLFRVCNCCTSCSGCQNLFGWITSTVVPSGVPNIGPGYESYYNASLAGDISTIAVESSFSGFDGEFFYGSADWRSSDHTVRAQSNVVRTLDGCPFTRTFPVYAKVVRSGYVVVLIKCISHATAGQAVAIAATYVTSRTGESNTVNNERTSDEKATCPNASCSSASYSGTFCRGQFVQQYRLSTSTATDGAYVPVFSQASGDCRMTSSSASSREVLFPSSPVSVITSADGVTVSTNDRETFFPWVLFSTTNTAEEVVLTNHTACDVTGWAAADTTLSRWQYTPTVWPRFSFTIN